MPSRPCALAISGLDPSGGAGVFADLRAFAAAGVWGCGAISVMTVQSTSGVRSCTPVPSGELVAQVEELWENQRIRSVKIGALGGASNVEAVSRLVRRMPRVPLVVDPVLLPTRGARGARLLERHAERALLQLVEVATVVTPNVGEAGALLGMKISSVRDAEAAARELAAIGARAALVKGGHLSGPEAVDVLALKNRIIHLRARRIRKEVHGTGCALSALIAGKLALAAKVDDEAILASVRWAKRRVGAAIERSFHIGNGLAVLAP